MWQKRMYIDSHSHISYVTHDIQHDVESTIICACTESEFETLSVMAKNDSNIYPAFGVHPWYIDSVSDDWYKKQKKLLKQDVKYMVGEIGLDKYKPNMEKQIDIFKQQLKLASELNRPVFLHCVGAWDKILHVFKDNKKHLPPIMVAHAFSGSEDILKTLVEEYDMYISFNRINDTNEDLIKIIPLDKLLVETDAKDLSISNLVYKIGKIVNCDNIDSIIYANAKRVLNGK